MTEPLRCISLDQPSATLVALDVKRMETRSWQTKHRGRIGIASTAKKPVVGPIGRWEAWAADPPGKIHPNHTGPRPARLYCNDLALWAGAGSWCALPLGALVATANLVDCVPIVEWGADPQCDHITIGGDGRLRAWHFLPGSLPLAWQALDPAKRASAGGPNEDDRSDQLPYGDYRPGRFAWILEDIKATTERCPACWGTGDHERVDALTDEVIDVDLRLACARCLGDGYCVDPIPVKGKQGWWWWQP